MADNTEQQAEDVIVNAKVRAMALAKNPVLLTLSLTGLAGNGRLNRSQADHLARAHQTDGLLRHAHGTDPSHQILKARITS